METLSYRHHGTTVNDKCWFFPSLPNLCPRNLALQRKPSWNMFTVRGAHCVHALYWLKATTCSQTLPSCTASSEKGCCACRSYLPLLLPGTSLAPPLKINRRRGCLSNRWKSLTGRCQKPLQCSSVLPADKLLLHLKQKAAWGPLTYVLRQILLKQLKALPPMQTLLPALLLCRRLLVAHSEGGWWMDI